MFRDSQESIPLIESLHRLTLEQSDSAHYMLISLTLTGGLDR